MSPRLTLRSGALVTLLSALLLAPVARGQDSVMIIRGGSGVPQRPVAERPDGLDPGELPDFLTPNECARLVRYRDGALAAEANRALTRAEVNADAAVDMTALSDQLQRDYATMQLLQLRNSIGFVVRQTADAVETAFKVAQFLALPSGAPKSVGQIVTDLARKGGAAGAAAVADGKLDAYRRRMNDAATNLDAALQRLIRDSELVRRAQTLEQAQRGLDEIRTTRIPEVEAQISAYREAAREANRELTDINAELQGIDTALRKACN